MTNGRDDDALSWDGDDDPTLDVGTSADPDDTPPDPADADVDAAAGAELPDGFTAVGKGSETVGAAAAPDMARADRGPMGNGELIGVGVLGGVYALFAIGWIIGGLRLQDWRPFLVSDAMYQGSLWLAVLAPVLWFATVFLLTRASRAWVRFAWLAAGVVLLVPWPFVLIGAVGQ
ncbi:DNA polymerase III subunit gamma/tau [Microbacterium sp. NPDC058389]|uniref:DNA polymerase III subunit gamma/tau n=1 Tax=Microbacterium sp. NPDC058389 TaxID=3346475 RepID=UPI003661182E